MNIAPVPETISYINNVATTESIIFRAITKRPYSYNQEEACPAFGVCLFLVIFGAGYLYSGSELMSL